MRKEEQQRREEILQKQAAIPDGFIRQSEGLYYNPAQRMYWMSKTEKFYTYNEATKEYTEVPPEVPIEKELRLVADASSFHPHALREDRHVIVKDLAKAAQALKMPVDHLPRPVALYAVYTGHRAKSEATEDAAPECAQFCARNLHLKLLPRLSEFKGPWDDERLRTALRDSFDELDAEFLARPGGASDGCSAVIALLTGRRLLLAGTGDAVAVVGQEAEDGSLRITRRTVSHRADWNSRLPLTRAFGDRALKDKAATPPMVATPDIQVVLLEKKLRVVALGSHDIMALPDTDLAAMLRRRLGRPRVAAGALLQAAQKAGAAGSLTSLCVFFDWNAAEAESKVAEPAAKRPRVDAAAQAKKSQVRCRQILVRHKECKEPVDMVRTKKPVTRSLAEAEAILREALEAIETAPGKSVFTQRCKAVSECSTSLKGGEMAGDLGWLSRGQAHPAVEAAAFALPVGHISDIVESDDGVHLLWRIA